MRSVRFVLVLITALILVAFSAAEAWADGPSDGLTPAPAVDRGSPRRAFEGFLRTGDRGEFAQAAHYLDLRSIPKGRQQKDGPVVAEKLHYVLTHAAKLDASKVPDDPDTELPKGDTVLEVAVLEVLDGPVPVGMTRARFADGVERWVFAKNTVAIAPTLYKTIGRPSFGDRLPAALRVSFLGNESWQWLALIALVPLAYVASRVGAFVIVHALGFLARRTPTAVDDALVAGVKEPLRLALTALLLDAVTPQLHLTSSVEHSMEHATFTMLVIGGAWMAMRAVSTIANGIVTGVADSPQAEIARRRIRTRLAIFQRLAVVFVILVATALTLLQFDRVRAVGVSLLASAGLAGVVLGFAAQRSLGAVISGIQLSVTQPIRLGDNVVVEGEYGTVESIHLTQVIVALWDERRLVLPVSRFLEQPFQNWSKANDKLNGTVTLPCDFSTPIEPLRRELTRLCAESVHWDKKDCALQVTDVGDRSMTVRVLVSAATPGALWDLRCELREKLMEYLNRLDHGRALPRSRYDRISPFEQVDGGHAAPPS